MPAGDGSGSAGAGPMTGRGAGFCAGNDAPGYANRMPGFGGRPAQGGRRGWRRWFRATGVPGWMRFGRAPAWAMPPAEGFPPAAGFGPGVAPPTREQEVAARKAQAEWLRQQLDAVNQRITQLEEE